MHYAVVDAGIVVNVIEWDGVQRWSPPEGCAAIQSNEAGIGWTYDGRAFTAPARVEPEPESSELDELRMELEAVKRANVGLATRLLVVEAKTADVAAAVDGP